MWQSHKLDVPLILQEDVGYCLPACVEMIPAYYGIRRAQKDIAKQLGIFTGFGIPASRVMRLASRQLDVVWRSGESSDLLDALSSGVPPIVEVSTKQLGYWRGEDTEHVVLLAAIEDSQSRMLAVVNDPAFNSPVTLLMDELLLAWGERDNRFAMIRPK